MREAFRGGWPFSHPPNMDFELNWRSPQADGLVFWLPLGINQSTGTRHVGRVRGLSLAEINTPTWVVDGQRGWHMLFDDGASESLEGITAPVTAAPFTLSCWFNTDQAALRMASISLVNSTAALHEWLVLYVEGGFVKIRSRSPIGGTSGIAVASAAYTVNRTHHMCGVAVSATERHAYMDGVNKGSNAANCAPVGIDIMGVGATVENPASTHHFSGSLSDIRIYNRALPDAEVYAQYAPSTRWELYAPRVRFWPGFADGCVTTVTVTETATVTVAAQV